MGAQKGCYYYYYYDYDYDYDYNYDDDDDYYYCTSLKPLPCNEPQAELAVFRNLELLPRHVASEAVESRDMSSCAK